MNDPNDPTVRAGESPSPATQAPSSDTPEGEPRDPTTPPRLEIVLGTNDVLHVRNVGDEVVRLRGSVQLERRTERGWESLPLDFGLRATCDQPVPECVSLVPGAELLPPRWLGTQGDAQCACERCVAVTGELRFVVQSCAPDGHSDHRVEGEPFTRRASR